MKRFLSIATAVCLLASASACTPGGSSATTGGSGVADSAAESGDWRTPYKEAPVVHIVNDEVASATYDEGMDIYDNIWTRRWKEKYNVEIVTDWVSNDFDTKLNLSIASKELPDMFHCNNVQFQQLLAADMLADITDAYNQYASPGLKTIMSKDPEMFETAFKDGKMYGVPRLHYGYTCEPGFMWYRSDWMAEAGNPEIKTVDDLTNLMRKFKADHNLPYAISMDKLLTPFFFMTPAWHSAARDGTTARMWVDDGKGGIMSAYLQPEMKNALAQWSSWYQEGLVRPDFATVENEILVEDIVNGTVGICSGANWYGWQWQDVVKNFGNESIYEAYDLPSVDGKPIYYPIAFINDGYGVVTKGAKNPEVLVKLINDYAYVLNEATVDGSMTPAEVLPFSSNDIHHVTGPFKVLFRSYDDVKDVITAIRTGEEKFTTGYARSYYDETMKWIKDKEFSSLGRYAQQGSDKGSLVISNAYEDNNLWLFTKTWGPAPQAELDNGSILDDIINEGVTQIIAGMEPIDHWDTVIANWLSAGGDEMTKAVNDAYGSK